MQVASRYFTSIQQLLTNLRSFPNGTRNCYTLPVKQGNSSSTSTKHLIRATFFYGNYDGLWQTPEFDLYIDVNYWTTVKSNYTSSEIIYSTWRNYINVCLVNIGSGVPFISVLEARLLDNSIYSTTSGALQTTFRLNMGSLDIYRHPYDVYDRIWEGIQFAEFTTVTNTTNLDSLKDDNINTYKVPTEVLMTAQQTTNSSVGMGLLWGPLNSTNKWYVYLHFAEIQVLPAGQQRELEVYLSDKTLVANLMLQYLKPVTLSLPPVSGINPGFAIVSKSNFSAFINAVEVFLFTDLPNSPTDLNNVNAINDIKSTYGVFGDLWQGDPCVPQKFTWRGLVCTQDNLPKITSLNMSSSGLKGTIAASFFNLSALETLDLSYNELSGPLPEFLAFMPNLRVLNLSNNNLSGTVPEVLLKKSSADGTLTLRLDGNPSLCLTNCNTSAMPPSSSNNGGEKKQHTIHPLVTAVASAILVLILNKWD
ncbi:hypothetical protein SAY86_017743 [Trapa natans]|uniref:Malectin-like domain-containing protein n=1 Tax=Trapa natans TaxID=22666 RepID=A0AAN7LST4_TRANT|nr:hypothetical protein SAY86_017743 [Trapa natans]